MPKPAGVSDTKWAQIERQVKRHCEKLAKKNGWQEERKNKCIYGTLAGIKDNLESHQRKRANIKKNTGAAV